MIEQRGAGARRAFALEPFDERGEFGSDGAQLAAILARFGVKCGQSVATVAQSPLQQSVHRHLPARGIRKVVEARGDVLSALRQFAARERFQDQRSN